MSKLPALAVTSALALFLVVCDPTSPPPDGEPGPGNSGGQGPGGNDGDGEPVDPAPGGGTGGGQDAGVPVPDWVGPDGGVSSQMTFFVSSRGGGKGGDLRASPTDTDGLAGADALCKSLAAAVSPVLGAKTWRAYLSTSSVNARTRIGNGPWRNAKGLVIANDLAHLHDESGGRNALSYDNSLDEYGNRVPGSVRPTGTSNVHDILTGTDVAGTANANHCNNWTSSASSGVRAQVGHSDRAGGGSTNWNSVHTTGGCAESGSGSVRTGGGRGSLFCFVEN